jgi:hypothetical protein
MTLEEAILHAEEIAEEYEKQVIWLRSKEGNPNCEHYVDRAKEHRQLAEWLRVLKEILDSGDCNGCRNGQCEWKPKLGGLVRFNCPHYVGIANAEVKADENSD